MLKVPNFNNMKPPKLQKKLRLIRGHERGPNAELVHNQYAVIAEQGGRIEFKHIEHMRLQIAHKLDTKRAFAVWRIPEPWQPLTKKGIGQRMGAGKGAIDRYCVPIKTGQIIIEMGGKCGFNEIKHMLEHCARSLPFKARAVSKEMLEKDQLDNQLKVDNNLNRWTAKYVIMNNMSGCHRWLRPRDHHYFLANE